MHCVGNSVQSKYVDIEIPNATSLVIKFDNQTCLDSDNDNYLTLYKDHSYSDYYGKVKRMSGSKDWPGVDGNSDLTIPSGKFVLFYQFSASNGGRNQWGYKFTVTGNIVN